MYFLLLRCVIQYLELSGPAFDSRYWCVFSCSAVTGDGIQDGFDWLVDHTYAGLQAQQYTTQQE